MKQELAACPVSSECTVSLGFATGLCPAELAGLKTADVDLERRRQHTRGGQGHDARRRSRDGGSAVEPGPAPTFGEALDVPPVAGGDPLLFLGGPEPVDGAEHGIVIVHRLQVDTHLQAGRGEQPFEGRERGIGMTRLDPGDRRLRDTRSRRQLALAEPGAYPCAREKPTGNGRAGGESVDDGHDLMIAQTPSRPQRANGPGRSAHA